MLLGTLGDRGCRRWWRWDHKNGLFINPVTWDELFAPQIRRLIEHVKSKGFLHLQHSCGKNVRLVPHMIAAGIDVWISSQAINDLHSIVVMGKRDFCVEDEFYRYTRELYSK